MSGWVAKRFWTQARVDPVPGGYAVLLDTRPVKTPAKAPLVLPTPELAQAVADEWQAQQGVIRPDTMPFTRSANSALDKITPQFAQVADLIAAYGGSDLICYRAPGPDALCQRQAAAWDPLLDWAARVLQAPLAVTQGVVPVAQPQASLARLSDHVHAVTPFQMAALHDLVALSGSLVIGLAVARGHLAADQAWAISRTDEDWQIEQWGVDDEAAESAAIKRAAFLHAQRFWELCG